MLAYGNVKVSGVWRRSIGVGAEPCVEEEPAKIVLGHSCCVRDDEGIFPA